MSMFRYAVRGVTDIVTKAAVNGAVKVGGRSVQVMTWRSYSLDLLQEQQNGPVHRVPKILITGELSVDACG